MIVQYRVPTVKHTPANESKVHNDRGPFPPFWSSHLLVTSCVGKPGQDMGFKVHNGEGPYPHPDLFPQYSGVPYPRNRTFSQISPKNNLRDLLIVHKSQWKLHV